VSGDDSNVDGAEKAIAFKNGQVSKLPIHSRELFKDAIAFPIERLSRTSRTVLKTAVTGSYAEAITRSGQLSVANPTATLDEP
jgi:hypothetical protein